MIHGGNVYELNLPLDEVIDLSASTNPLILEYLSEIKKLVLSCTQEIIFYPEPRAEGLLKEISEYYQVPLEGIILSNGSVELIYALIVAISPKRVCILEPSFVEYSIACRNLKVKDVKPLFALDPDEWLSLLEKELQKQRYDLVFICNPNNPTAWILEREKILKLVTQFEDTTFVIDEAFIEFKEGESLLKEAFFRKNLLVLRSFTKFYGLAGLRLGYGVGNFNLINELKKVIPLWSVNTFAQRLGSYILKNEEFKKRSLEFFSKERLFVQTRFSELGVEFFPSQTNFILFYLKDGKLFWKHLYEKGILIRSCENFYGLSSDYLRISLKTRKENQRFLEELENWLRDF